MKKEFGCRLCAFVVAVGVAGLLPAAEKWSPHTTDDFSQRLLFAEYWKVDNAAAIRSEDGHVVFSGKAMMIPKVTTPKKFRASVDLGVKRGTADLRCGGTIASVKAGEKKRVTIACEGNQENFASIRICCDGEGFVDNFEVLRAVDDAASPNLVVNGGMEYVEDGMPPYMKHDAGFPITQWKHYDYRKYTHLCGADTQNPHSGKYALRISCDATIRRQDVGIIRIATSKGRSGVFSLWARTDHSGTPLTVTYAGAKRTFETTREWQRYEVVSTNLPGYSFFRRVASLRVELPQDAKAATVWVDDIQAEYLDRAPTATELASGKTFATPFRENDFDKTRFSEVIPHRAPTLEVPCLAKDVKPSVKLDDWIGGAAKFGDYYNMTKPAVHRTESYIACDEENIYIGMRAYGEKFLQRPTGQAEGHDSCGNLVFGAQNSSIELMFDPADVCKPWHFAFNDFGFWDKGANRDVKWTGDWTHALVRNEEKDATDYFMALPWKHLRGAGLRDAFPLMVSRNDAAAGEFTTPYVAERSGFVNTYDWWPIAKFPAAIVAKYRLAETERKATETKVMPWLNFYMEEPAAKFRVTTPDGRVREESVSLANMPFGTNDVMVAGIRQKIIKRPYRKYACQVNHWTRCLRKNGKNILFVGAFPVDFSFARANDKHVAVEYPDFFSDYCGHKYVLLLVPTAQANPYFDGEPFAGLKNGRLAIERARQNGMQVLLWTGFGDVRGVKDAEEAAFHQQMVDQFLEFDNILSFLVTDEPEISGLTSDQTRDYLRRVRAMIPYNPVQMNNTIMGIPNRWADLETDVLMLDNYLTANDQCPLENIIKCADEMREVGATEGKPCYYFIVGNNELHYKEPTFDEQVAQCWGLVCSGCTGLSFFIKVPSVPGAFEAFCQVPREIGEVEDILVSDELCGETVASVGKKDLRLITRRLGDDKLVATCNIQKRSLGTVEFALPPDFPQGGSAEVLFENRTLPIKDGKFSDDFKPYARHVYRIR